MDFVQLQYFVTAAKEQHFTRAANKLNISQPTLSISISRLESELGCRLFLRNGRQVLLNESGEVLLKYAEIILKAQEDALLELETLHRRDTNSLTIACMTLHVHNLFLRRFQEAHPDIHVSQKMLLVDGLDAALRDNNIDFIIANVLSEDHSVQCYHLTKDPLYLAISRSHKLSKKASYALEDLLDIPFVINPEGTGFAKIFNSLFTRKHLPVPKVTYALPSEWQDYLNKGYAGLLTEAYFLNTRVFDSSVTFLPPEDPSCCRELYLLWNGQHTLSKAAKKFLQAVENNEFN